MTDGQSVGSLWLEQAQEAAEQRRFAEAVATYVRFHEHVLDHDPGMRGVRASFAVGDWGRLAVAYPPARDAMMATRERAVARLKDPSVLRDDGTPGVALDDLQGVVALNEELRRPEDTVDLVRWLDSHRPDLAVEGASIVRAVLVAEGELELAARYLEDLDATVEAWAAVLNEQTAHGPEDPPGAPPTRASHVRIYADRVGQVLTVLRGTGQPDRADQLAAAAITAVGRPDVAAAVRTRLL